MPPWPALVLIGGMLLIQAWHVLRLRRAIARWEFEADRLERMARALRAITTELLRRLREPQPDE